jgi:glycosyltransferase involved in cell wall biosynthesis
LRLLQACLKKIHTFDCVHSIGLWTFPSFVASAIAFHAKIPFVLSLHGGLMQWAYGRHHGRKVVFLKMIESRRLANAKAVICSSDMEKKHFERLNLPGRVQVIPNIIYPIEITISEARQRFRLPRNLNGKIVLLFAGRLVRNKGLLLTFEAFSSIASRHPQVHLVIAGPSEDESGPLIQQRVSDLGLSNKVTFLGTLSGSDYWDAVAGSDLFVLNSYSENFGMAPAEALSLGVPVLISDQVGISDLVVKYRAGVVTPLDLQAITGAMDSILTDRVALYQMGQNGMRLVQENFSASVVGKQFRDLLGDIVYASSRRSNEGGEG